MTAERKPTKAERAVLEVLDEEGGFSTRMVALQTQTWPPRATPRQNSTHVRQRLLALAVLGWVATLDNQKPVCWTRTPAGTAAMGETP